MTTATQAGEAIAAHRRRYEALRDAGQGETARGLPPLDAAPPVIPDGSVLEREELPGGCYWTGRLRRGEALRLVNREGSSAVALIAWRADEPSERINVADTVKVQWSAALRPGRVILSDMGRVVFSIVADDTGAHDALAGGSNAATCAEKHGPGAWRNTRDNFVAAVGKLGLDKRDIPPCLTLFAPVSVAADGTLSWEARPPQAGQLRRPESRDGPDGRPLELPAPRRSRHGLRAGAGRSRAVQGRECTDRRPLPHRQSRGAARLRPHRPPPARHRRRSPLMTTTGAAGAAAPVEDHVVPAERPWSRVVRRGETLRIIDIEGQQAVDFLLYNADDHAERYSAQGHDPGRGPRPTCRSGPRSIRARDA